MTRKEELEEQIKFLNEDIYKLIRLCLSVGNEKPQDNFMVKNRMELLQKYKKELELIENDNN